jgi:hypothetical protein
MRLERGLAPHRSVGDCLVPNGAGCDHCLKLGSTDLFPTWYTGFMSDGDQRIERMAGCARIGRSGLVLFALSLLLGLLLTPNRCTSDGPGHVNLDVLQTIVALREAVQSYLVEYEHYPVGQGQTSNGDLQTTSRGLLLSLLMGMNSEGLNKKKIVFCEFKMARKQRAGIWQDGNEWVLCDFWGRAYEMILDTDSDGSVLNPDPNSPRRILNHPIAIFSAGPDGDPATWADNIKSW